MSTERDRKLWEVYRRLDSALESRRPASRLTALEASALESVEATAPAASEDDLPLLTEDAIPDLLATALELPSDSPVAERVVDGRVRAAEYLRALDELKTQFDAPADALESALLAPIAFERVVARRPPGDWRFPAWSEAITPTPESYEVENRKFETFGDIRGWALNCAQTLLPWVKERNVALARKNFRPLSTVPSRGEYPMPALDAKKPLRLALVGDFGTGLVHSKYIGHQLAALDADYAVHLGDVYYAGRKAEYETNFVQPLQPLIERRKTQFFNIAGNHDQFSGNSFYWADIDRRRGLGQIQDSSCFRLFNDEYQIIGLDTNSKALERYADDELRAWLIRCLKEGRDKKRTNILLTSEDAYDYVELPHRVHPRGQLYKDLELATDNTGEIFRDGLVDLWFWCHVHYATFNGPAPELGYPFIGSCLGHGGYPYGRQKHPVNASFVRWTETAPRFPTRLGIRPDMGNNGFCIADLRKDSMTLTYKDWMGYRRCEVEMARSTSGTLTIASVTPYPEETI